MAELTTDDGSTASPEAIRRFEERNNAVPDQTTDHLSRAVLAANERARAEHHFHPYDHITRTILETPEVATYYEDKGAEKLKRVEGQRDRSDALAEEASHDAEEAEAELAAAEDKGRSEERERLRAAIETREKRRDAFDETPLESLDAVLASLDSDQEGS